jgi:hypothetical protein
VRSAVATRSRSTTLTLTGGGVSQALNVYVGM